MDENDRTIESENRAIRRLVEEGFSVVKAVRKVKQKSDRSEDALRKNYYDSLP